MPLCSSQPQFNACFKCLSDKFGFSLTLFPSPAFELGLDHVLANPPGHRNLNSTVSRFAELFANEETYDNLELTSLHRSILGISNVDLETHLSLSISEINTTDAGGRTPLFWAARRGDISSIRTLLKYGANVEKPDRSYCRPIHKAVADSDDECVRVLLEAGADPTPADDGGAQPIHNVFFSPYNRTRSIEALLAHGADINARCDRGSTALHWAVDSPNTEGVMDNIHCLFDHGIDIEALDKFGDLAVVDAIATRDLRMLEFLIERGAVLDRKRQYGTTALHVAAWNGTLECWEMLAAAARIGKFQNLDLEARHEKHDIWHCLDKCRGKRFAGDRQSPELEKQAFQRLIQSIEGIVFEQGPEDNTAGSKTTILGDQLELSSTDDESVYVDAEEVLCS